LLLFLVYLRHILLFYLTAKTVRSNHKLEASYTVEAAILTPIILIVFGILMKTGIDLYQDIIKEAEHLKLMELDVIETFRNMKLVQNWLK